MQGDKTYAAPTILAATFDVTIRFFPGVHPADFAELHLKDGGCRVFAVPGRWRRYREMLSMNVVEFTPWSLSGPLWPGFWEP
jgi:hypothetical protein